MNWEAIGAVGEIVGAAAVIASLIYLASQIRHSSKAMRSQNLNAQTQQLLAIEQLQSQTVLHEPLKNCYIRNIENLSEDDAGYIESYLLSMLAVARNQYLHKQEGLDSDWEVISARVPSFFSPIWPQKWWREHGHTLFEPDFAKEVDKLIAKAADNDYWLQYGQEEGGGGDA